MKEYSGVRRSRSRSLHRLGWVVVGLFALGVSNPLAAQPIPKGNWIELATDSFNLVSNAGAGKTEDIAEELELLRQVLDLFIPLDGVTNTRPLTIILFRNVEAFEPYMRRLPPKGTVKSWEGYYSTTRDYLLLNGSRPTAELLPWALDAFASHHLSYRHRGLPFWLRRGLASFYATAEIERKGRVRLGRATESDIQTIRVRSFLPLDQLFQIESGSSFFQDPQGAALFNAESWAVAHYLLTGGGEGPTRGSRFLQLVGNGVSEEEAIRQAFGVDLRSLEQSLRGYINSRTLPGFTLTVQNLELPEMVATTLSSDRVAYELGLYLVTGHTPPPVAKVEDHLLPLVSGDGYGGDAQATLGELRRRSDLPAEASELFLEALEMNPTTATSYYLAADHLKEVDLTTHREVIQAALERAIELSPGLGRAYLLLSQTFTDDDRDAAIANLERAIAVMPDRADVAMSLVYRYINANDLESARAAAEEHLAGSPDRYQEASRVIVQRERQLLARDQNNRFNEAISLFNSRDMAGARSIAEELRPTVEDAQLGKRIDDLIEAIESAASGG